MDILENIYDRKEEEDSKKSKELIDYSINLGAFDFLLDNINKSENSKDLNKLPIFEPELDKIIGRCRGKNLHFSNEIEKHISNADMIFISVNTPTKKKGVGAGQASDLKWWKNVQDK